MSDRIGFVETPLEIARLMVDLADAERDAFVLDTGCGRGVFLRALDEKGYRNVYGIEIDGDLYGYCLQKFGKQFEIIHGDFLTYDFDRKFHLIIGNPPYVHFNRLPPELANTVRKLVRTGEGDIYYAFILRAISLLREGGELIYIVPYHFFYNTYAKVVREALLKFGKLEVVIDLDEVRLFHGENPETVIFKFRKGKYDLQKERIHLLQIKSKRTNASEIYEKALSSLSSRASNSLFEYAHAPHYSSPQPWSSFVFHIPHFPSIKLKEIARVGVGPVSGFDEAFVLNGQEWNLNDRERKLVRKFVKGKNCRRFIVEGFESYVVIDDSIRSESQLKALYPNVYRRLLTYKDRMSKRYLPRGKEWFHWQALRNYGFLMNHLGRRRIYVPTLDRHPYNRFSLGEGGLLPSADVLFIQPHREEDLHFLLGYLNSEFFRKYYLAKGGRRGGRVSFTQKLLENVEIPLFSKEIKGEIAATAKRILWMMERGEETSGLENRIEDLIHSAMENEKFEKWGLSLM